MCFSEKLSFVTLVAGIVTSILLIYYGNEQYKKENLITGIFLIFVICMQLFEYIFGKIPKINMDTTIW